MVKFDYHQPSQNLLFLQILLQRMLTYQYHFFWPKEHYPWIEENFIFSCKISFSFFFLYILFVFTVDDWIHLQMPWRNENNNNKIRNNFHMRNQLTLSGQNFWVSNANRTYDSLFHFIIECHEGQWAETFARAPCNRKLIKISLKQKKNLLSWKHNLEPLWLIVKSLAN